MRKKMKEQDTLKYDIKLRVNQYHFDRLNKLLSASRHRTMSELLREIVCERKVIIYTRDESLDVVMGELTRIRKELNAIGTNINQITRQVNGNWPAAVKSPLVLEAVSVLEQAKPGTQELFSIISQLATKWLQK